MFGGVGKSAGWATILGAVGVVLGGSVSAQAADLGGDCCTDLEERVAELEATTARKGNRKVSLKISGWVNEQVLWWDDGNESNVYVGNNDQERSRFKFAGEAKIDKDWSAGYTIEIGVRTSKSSSYNAASDEGGASAGQLDTRKSSWFIKSKTYGKFTLGRDGSATYHLLDDSDFINTRYYADAESIPSIGIAGFSVLVNGIATGLLWGGNGNTSLLAKGANNTPGNGERPEIIRYETPDFKGFSAAAAWGEDDVWDVAGIYVGELGDFKVAGRAGYAEYTDGDGASPGGTHCVNDPIAPGGQHCQEWGGSATIQHKPTGLFVYGAYGQKHDDGVRGAIATLAAPANAGPVDDEDKMYYVQAGIEKKWLPLGTTTIFGTYRHDDNGSRVINVSAAIAPPFVPANTYVGGSDVNTWGGGVVQNIEPAAMDLYLIYSHVDGSFDVVNRVDGAVKELDIDNFDLLQAGARIQF